LKEAKKATVQGGEAMNVLRNAFFKATSDESKAITL